MLRAAREALLGAVDARGNKINKSHNDLLIAWVVGQDASTAHQQLGLVPCWIGIH